jgi:FAD/FMN-containing dehydrogenase
MSPNPTLTGRIIYPGDPVWDYARKGFCARADFAANTPQAVVYALNTADVQNAIAWVKANDVPLALRSGGHSFEGYSSFAKDGIILDLSELEHVRVSSKDTTATVGAGIDMLELSEHLCYSGRIVPLATGPSVSLGGFVQGGGFGFASRLQGLACDNLIEAEIVTAEGEILRISEKQYDDLFWAIRGGGGGNFGVLTECVFNTHPAGLVAVAQIGWQWEAFEEVVSAWQDWFPTLPNEMTTLLSLTLDGKITLYTQLTTTPDKLGDIGPMLLPMIALKPTSLNVQALPYQIAARLFFGTDLMNPTWAIRQHGDDQLFKSASAVAFKPFPPEAITKMKKWLDSCPPLSATPSQPSMIQLLGGGGAISAVPIDATAVYQRDAHFIVQYDGYWTAPQDRDPTYNWVVAMRKDMLPYAHGAYVNYHDRDLENPLEEYYGPHVAKLKSIKAKYDPGNFFKYAQSL